MRGEAEIAGRFLGVFDGPVGPGPVPADTVALPPGRTIVFDDVALRYPRRNRDFVVYFRPETNLPPMTVRGTGVDLVGPSYGIWVGDPAAKTFVSVFRVEDVLRIVQESAGGHSTAT